MNDLLYHALGWIGSKIRQIKFCAQIIWFIVLWTSFFVPVFYLHTWSSLGAKALGTITQILADFVATITTTNDSCNCIQITWDASHRIDQCVVWFFQFMQKKTVFVPSLLVVLWPWVMMHIFSSWNQKTYVTPWSLLWLVSCTICPLVAMTLLVVVVAVLK